MMHTTIKLTVRKTNRMLSQRRVLMVILSPTVCGWMQIIFLYYPHIGKVSVGKFRVGIYERAGQTFPISQPGQGATDSSGILLSPL